MPETYRSHILICGGTGCVAGRSIYIKSVLEEELKLKGLSSEVRVIMTGCNGFCAQGPVMVVHPDGIFYQRITPEDIPLIVSEHILKGRPVVPLMYREPVTEEAIPRMRDIPFFNLQVLRALRNRGLIDAERAEEYIARDGYMALAKALLEMTPEDIIKEVKSSGLRGRGGAGFPTGLKWEFAHRSPGPIKYMLCNGDEGDPGAFMDRSIMEADPHSVIEGMIIGARAIGANYGYIYVRAEYPLAVARLSIAIEKARSLGLLGNDILGSGFDFDLEIYQGAGAFVCGEETALMFSLEGKRGMPRPRPPFPALSGLWQKPTVLNNVETLANIPPLILHGAEWFASLGTERSKGTKVFALTGAINNIGLVEVPMGTTVRTIIFDIGGGIKGGKRFKAVQLGGPSGGCIPASLLDTPIDYESITETGAIMGSGGMVVMDESTCMVAMAKFFLEFTQDESCGKCIPCRVGTHIMLEKLIDICSGKGEEGDIELLEDLAKDIKGSALCGLGQTAPNPVLTTIRYFRDEYESHIRYKRCEALVCKDLISSPCQHTCPIGLDIPQYVTLTGMGKFSEALALIRTKLPFPSVCGRVCTHACETRCRRGELDSPVSINNIKRFLSDYGRLTEDIKEEPAPTVIKEDKVAIVGGGPAGLTCAYYLAKEGYRCTIFEAQRVLGGMLTLGIPEYRLPKKILNSEIDRVLSLGIEVKTGVRLGKDITLSELRSQGYKAIFLAIGAHKGMRLGIEGEDHQNIVDCIEFLRKVNLGQEVKIGDRVGIIGGGNAAIDAARTALRIGAKEVKILYRRTESEMPAVRSEIEEAKHEGVEFVFLTAPKRIAPQNGAIGLECISMQLGSPDESGRPRPIPIDGSEHIVWLDNIILAVGQTPYLEDIVRNEEGLATTKGNLLKVSKGILATDIEGVFAGGDVVTGPLTVISAIAQGRLAAQFIDKYLSGEELERVYEVTRPQVFVPPLELEEEMGAFKRPLMPTLSLLEREKNFKEVDLGLTQEMVMSEAKRCLRCDLGGE